MSATRNLAAGVDRLVNAVACAPTDCRQARNDDRPDRHGDRGDPLYFGIVGNLAHPGGNITGTTLFGHELASKRLEVLKQAAPDIARIAVLGTARYPMGEIYWMEAERAARALGIDVTTEELPAAFSDMAKDHAQALVVLSDATFNSARKQIAGLAAEHRLPAIHEAREFVETGGLISYGPDVAQMTRRSAIILDKVLKGCGAQKS
jgi:ABC-type uncharacterized transport system substrate-binding protein